MAGIIFCIIILGVLFAFFIASMIIGQLRFNKYKRAKSFPAADDERWQRRNNTLFAQIAEQYGGHYERGEAGESPRVIFEHADARVLINIHTLGEGEGEVHYTHVNFFYERQEQVRAEIYPEGSLSRFKKLFGMQDILIGSHKFDERYIIQGNDSTALRKMLSPGVRQQIERLRRLNRDDYLYLAVNRIRLLVKKRANFNNLAKLQRYIQLAIELYDQAFPRLDEGIEFVKNTALIKIEETVCQICGEAMEDNIVNCRSCKTPHHLECWRYYGACSTYGCLERAYEHQ